MPCDSSNVDNVEASNQNREDFVDLAKDSGDKTKDACGVAGLTCEANGESENNGRVAVDFVKKNQIFRSKSELEQTIEVCAMKNYFDFVITKSTTKWWCVKCVETICKWSVRAQSVEGSTYFRINRCESRHTCAASKKRSFGRTPSAKTIANLIKHQYQGSLDGPKANDIIQYMRLEYGCDISYHHAWEARELAVALVRGIPEESYHKIPSYLHMLKEANPGTHTNYKTDEKDRFKYLFLSFGQSKRGFYNAMRRVIVVDGTFLKNKYKGVLLVATAIDGNSNLYPIAFGVVDSENDDSWEWFFRELRHVIDDDKGLAFVSDRGPAISRAIELMYPQSSHGICIHHLLNNVVTSYKAKGLVALVEKASRAYRYIDFQVLFGEIYDMSPAVGKYLQDADARKWARCLFPGFRYDIRTNNPAESINAVLKARREYPVIPLLDSITDLVSRWFFERRELSSKQIDPLTITVEKIIDRRIDKAKGFHVSKIDEYRSVVRGDEYDCHVDLERRTCTCGKYDLGRIPCRHAIPAIYSRGMEVHRFTEDLRTTTLWRTAYAESVTPIPIPKCEWKVPDAVKNSPVLPPESRRAAGRRRKRRFETVEDKLRASQGSQRSKLHRCSRCHLFGHKRNTCDNPI